MFRWIKRIALGVLALLLLLVLSAGLGVAWMWWQMGAALPQLAGTERVPGLRAEVEILRDRYGVPHISASSTQDAYFGLGWAIAQDRLFQLLLNRHVAQGRLGELAGLWKPVRDIDLGLRELNLHGYGKVVYERASPEAQAGLAAYYRGVNAWSAAHADSLPVDVRVLRWLGADVSPFAPTDLLGMIGIMGLSLHDSWRMDVLAEQLAAKVGRERSRELFPLEAGGRPAVIPGPQPPVDFAPVPESSMGGGPRADAPAGASAQASNMGNRVPRAAFFERLTWLVDSPWLGAGASNNWAVAPSRSGQAQALLANDPHLGLSLPGLWYLAHLRTPELDVAGATFVGMPYVVIGRNADTAWGMTNLGVDAGDYFIERLNPDNAGQVRYRDAWVPLQERTETLHGKLSSEQVTVRSSPHGPLVSAFAPEEGRAALGPNEALSYRWAFLVDPRANEIEGFHQLNRVRDWQGFRAALRNFSGIAQNFVYADRAGNVGLQVAGAVPVLGQGAAGSGGHFRKGWDGSEEWAGLVPFEALPSLYNPARGWVASANNPTFEPPTPYYVSSTFEPAQRFEQIERWMNGSEPLDADAMRRMQMDAELPLAHDLVPQVLAAFAQAPPDDANERLGLALLGQWDKRFTAESPAAALFAYLHWRLHHMVFEDELGEELVRDYRGYPADAALIAAIRGELPGWVDDIRTAEVETLPAVLRRAFADAVQHLVEARGPEPEDWRWGALHTLTLQHPFSLVPGLGWLFALGPEGVGGYNLTLLRMGGRAGNWQVGHGASTRIVVDFGQPDTLLAVLPGGQSGRPRSPHFGDQFAPYLAGELLPIPLRREAALADGGQRLLLQPSP